MKKIVFIASMLCFLSEGMAQIKLPQPSVKGSMVSCVVMQLFGGLWFLSQRATEPAPHPARSQRTAEAEDAEQSRKARRTLR